MKLGQLSLSLYQKLAGAVASGSTLLNDIVSYWALDEQTGTRNDSVGSNHLTASVSSPTAVNRGPVGTVASFVAANTEHLDKADIFEPTTAATWSFWKKRATLSANETFLSKWTYATDGCWAIQSGDGVSAAADDITVFIATTANDDGTGCKMSFNDANTVAGQWHHIAVVYDGSLTGNANRLKLYVDGNAKTITADAGNVPASLLNSGAAFDIGNFPGLGRLLTGNMSRVGIWTSALSAANVTTLFNSGNGLDYDGVVAAGLDTNLVEFWNLDEVSGNRTGEKSATVLTDNATVGSVITGPLARVADFELDNVEYLTLASITDPGGAATISVWVNGESFANYRYPFRLSSSLWCYSGVGAALIANSYDGSDLNSITLPVMGTGEWHHFVMRYNADRTMDAWLDGVAGTTTDALASARSAYTALWVGADNGAVNQWDGKLSRLGIWSSALSNANVASLFNSGLGLDYDGVVAAGLDTNLVEYWNLDEVSGNRTGSKAATVLTDNASVLSTINTPPALDGAAAVFTAASSQQLTLANFVMPDSWTVAGWWYAESDDSGGLIGAVGTWPNSVQFSIDHPTANTIRALVGNGSAFKFATTARSDSATFVGIWTFFASWYDAADDIIHIAVNNEAADFVASATALTGTPFRTAATLKLSNDSGPSMLNGKLDEVAIWDRVLTAAEITELFAAGAGKFYPFA